MRKVFIVGGSPLHRNMYRDAGYAVTATLMGAELVHFTGGADVSPELYGQSPHATTHSMPNRDVNEQRLFAQIQRLGIPMVGECRGAQFLNVMSGGRMYQDVDGHSGVGSHMMVDLREGVLLETTSTHHQMMWPSVHATILAVASEATLYEYMDGDSIKQYIPERGDDIEVVYYEHTNSLCFQGHPEYTAKDSPCQKYFFELIEEYLYASNTKAA